MNASGNDEKSRPNAFPESELPKWLLRQLWILRRRAAAAVRGPEYKLLAQFSNDLRTCTGSSLDIARGLELCIKPIRKTRIGERLRGAADQVRRGSTLADALSPAEDLLPPFFLPVIRVGEQSGRLTDALSFLESHCSLLAGPASALRNVWLFPLAIMLAGSVIKFVLHLMMGSPVGALSILGQEFVGWLQLALIVAIAVLTPARYFIDQLRLTLPLIGPLEREIALHRFFRILALLYSVGGQRVEVMIRTSAQTVSNNAARIDLLKAATAIEEKATIPDAFRRVSILTGDEQTSIDVGEMSGTLEKAFDQISDRTGASMIAKLTILQPFLVRVVMALVAFSIIISLFSLMR